MGGTLSKDCQRAANRVQIHMSNRYIVLAKHVPRGKNRDALDSRRDCVAQSTGYAKRKLHIGASGHRDAAPEVCLFGCYLNQFYAAVLGSAVLGLIGSQRGPGSGAESDEARGGNAVF